MKRFLKRTLPLLLALVFTIIMVPMTLLSRTNDSEISQIVVSSSESTAVVNSNVTTENSQKSRLVSPPVVILLIAGFNLALLSIMKNKYIEDKDDKHNKRRS